MKENLSNYVVYFLLPIALGVIKLVMTYLEKHDKSCANKKPGTKLTYRVESFVFVSICLLFSLVVYNQNKRTYLNFEFLHPDYAVLHKILLVVLVLWILISIIVCLKKRLVIACMLAVSGFWCYLGLFVPALGNRVNPFMQAMAPGDSWKPVVTYSFELENSNEPVELFINDVSLGYTPVKIASQDLYNKVPALNQEEVNAYYKREDGGCRSVYLEWYKYGMHNGVYRKSYSQMCFFKIKVNGEFVEDYRIRHNGLPGYQVRYDYQYNILLNPREKWRRERDKKDRLLNYARLNDYQVEPQWFDEISSLGNSAILDDNWKYKDAQKFSQMYDQKAKETYGIGQKDPEEIFQKICRQLDAKGRFHTRQIEARALDFVHDKLRFKPLLKKYKKAISGYDRPYYSYSKGHRWGEVYYEFDHTPRENTLHHYFYTDQYPASMSAVGYVLSLWDKKFDIENNEEDNLIEEALSPLLIYRHSHDVYALEQFGGESYAKYLERQFRRHNWVVAMSGHHAGSASYKYGEMYNRYFESLINSQTETGKRFRAGNQMRSEQLAKRIITSTHNMNKDVPGFIFYDDKKIAIRLWETYLLAVQSSNQIQHEKSRLLMEYLAKCEDKATDRMYLQAWNNICYQFKYGYLNVNYYMRDHSMEHRLLVARHFWNQMQECHFDKEDQEEILSKITIELASCSDPNALSEFMDLEKSEKYVDHLWSFVNSDAAINHPFVEVLAGHPNPEMRESVLDIIERYPVKKYRNLLDELLNDSDEKVRKRASEVRDYLQQIKNMPEWEPAMADGQINASQPRRMISKLMYATDQ